MKILITGFDPFGKEKINPALEVVRRLPDEILEAKIIKLEIPTVFEKVGLTIEKAIKENQPDVVINIGQAGGRFAITPEKVAINLADARIADNAGYQPLDKTIFSDGKTAYFTQLPVKAMVAAMQAEKIPAEVSYTAGTYVCNYVMYYVQYLIDKKYPSLKGGFIHVPFIFEQVVGKPQQPAMNLNDMVIGLTAAIAAVVTHSKEDIKMVGGTEH
ncbi:pyrrolidone-carboxylate peptidase [Enterococcus saigonensis]|uniref:Pyrrolidone-carboxylate peptidase n=1 Tax=Enterococcus saigonensis TaxID=1805431 RepID=A0A679IC76_9ENTE|nr:pyroglutamyl-peptidase I [Enterococcus saigonensis]BCA85833.1 pyrrolidone-carboxylate peptidase [Enterococcus saigonensis]